MRHARIAVIGMGPRGLGALEALSERVPRDLAIEVDAFDPLGSPGAGPNFDPDESDLCLLNVPIRDIAIDPPDHALCGSFTDWLGQRADPDRFPPRPEIGRYLSARYAELQARGALRLSRHALRVERIVQDMAGWRIGTAGAWHGPYSEVLLTLGQPDVTPDDQIADWRRHAERSGAELAEAYPAARLQDLAEGWRGKTLAIRGLGLSTLDVLRILTRGLGGAFENGRYRASGREPARILPFSLDGKPPYPKPASQVVDAGFAPSATETAAFQYAVARAASSAPEAARALISDALAPAVERILLEAEAAPKASKVKKWLDAEWSDPGSQELNGPRDALRRGIEMAEGSRPPSIGYAVGQLWRKWQDELRTGYLSARTPPDCARTLVGFDEGLKRYSYGPPVSSARELAALADAGLVELGFAADPSITLTKGGWSLTCGDATVDASVMIDAVLPSPDLAAVRARPLSDLVDRGTICALGKGLAAATAADGRVIDSGGNVVSSLCLLGRLALGSVIAADSLHDCFGESADRWADGVIRRLG